MLASSCLRLRDAVADCSHALLPALSTSAQPAAAGDEIGTARAMGRILPRVAEAGQMALQQGETRETAGDPPC